MVGTLSSALLAVVVITNAMSVQLLLPYLQRLRSRSAVKAFRSANRWLILGFFLPWALVVSIPFVGVLAWSFAAASAGVFVADIRQPGDGLGWGESKGEGRD